MRLQWPRAHWPQKVDPTSRAFTLTVAYKTNIFSLGHKSRNMQIKEPRTGTLKILGGAALGNHCDAVAHRISIRLLCAAALFVRALRYNSSGMETAGRLSFSSFLSLLFVCIRTPLIHNFIPGAHTTNILAKSHHSHVPFSAAPGFVSKVAARDFLKWISQQVLFFYGHCSLSDVNAYMGKFLNLKHVRVCVPGVHLSSPPTSEAARLF